MTPMQKFLNRLGTELTKYMIALALGTLVYIFVTPVKEKMTLIWNGPERIEDVIGKLDELMQDVRILKRPRSVFRVSETNTYPVEGFCVTSSPCDIRVRVRRTVEALECRIVKGSVIWGFMNPVSDTFVSATRLDQPMHQNIGRDWRDIDIQLMTPPGLEPTAKFTFRALYSNCPGTDETDSPLEYTAEGVPFEIRNGDDL